MMSGLFLYVQSLSLEMQTAMEPEAETFGIAVQSIDQRYPHAHIKEAKMESSTDHVGGISESGSHVVAEIEPGNRVIIGLK